MTARRIPASRENAALSHKNWGVWRARDVRVMALLRTALRAQREIRRLHAALYREKQAAQLRSDLMAGVTHDFRTPVQSIAGMAKSAQRHLADRERASHCLRMILHASDYLLHLVDGLLDASSLEAGRLILREIPMRLADVVSCAVEMAAPQAAQRRQTLLVEQELRYSGALLGDGQRLCQVMVNLLSNAVKYTPPGGEIGLQVWAGEPDENGSVGVRFAVRDDGIGMSEETLANVFSPYVRAKSVERSSTEGTGLGLAISRALIEAMGGTISVESRINEGSTFTVALMMQAAPDEPAAEDTLEMEPGVFSGKRFLLAEDNGINADVLMELLQECGAQAERAIDGADAVALFASRPSGYYDAILMDLHMPGMNGFEAARAIRGMDRADAAGIPILAMTASVCAQDELLAIESGMNARIVKPVDLDALGYALCHV